MLDVLTVWVLAVLMTIAAVYGLLGMRHAPRHDRGRWEVRASDNPPAALQIAWPFLILAVSFSPLALAVAPDLAYGTTLNVSFPLDTVAQIVGFLLWGAGGSLVLWSRRVLGRFMVLEIAVTKDHELVRTGPYARIRHPTYAGAMAMSIGVAFFFLSYVLVALAIATIALAYYRARKEERLLSSPKGFGETYRAYIATTGQFLPRWRG